MARPPDLRSTHPLSPVQPGKSAAPIFVGAVLVLLVGMTVQQWWVDDVGPRTEPLTEEPSSRSNASADASAVSGDMRTIFSADDYPMQALRRQEQGTVRARLDVNSAGRVNRCTIVQSSNSKALDTATCAVLQRRAVFKPATDDVGNPIATTVDTPAIVWRLEG